MAITNFIPSVWSESLLRALEKNHTAVANCTREYEGDIREKGSVVKICGLNNVMIGDYIKNQNLSAPELLRDTVTELVIDQAKYFNFQIDDVDRAQAIPGLMDLALKNAAESLATCADSYVYSLGEHAGMTITNSTPTAENIIDTILQARACLMYGGVTDFNDVVLEVSPDVAILLMKSSLFHNVGAEEAILNGQLGTLCGCKVFVSPTIPLVDLDGGQAYGCLMRSRRAIAFAEQLSEVEAYRPELRFADGMKGLYLYGAKMVRPSEAVQILIATEN